MDKRTRERLEREKLKQLIENAPRLKSFLEASVDDTNENEEMKNLLESALLDTFDKIRMQGIKIGWEACTLAFRRKIKKCKTLEEVIDVIDKETEEIANKLGIDLGVEG